MAIKRTPGETPKKTFMAMTRGATIYSRLLRILKENPDLSLSGHVDNHQRYCYATAPDLDLTLEGVMADGSDFDEHVGALVDAVQKEMEEWCHDFNREMEKSFYKELEYRQSEEALSEDWDANEIKFDEDGDMVDSQVVHGRRVRTGLSFSELSPAAKEHALEKYRYWATGDNVWSEYLEEDFTKQLEYMGFNRVEISYSLGYGQGDGACFTSGSIDMPKFLERMAKKAKPTDAFNVPEQAESLVEGLLCS